MSSKKKRESLKYSTKLAFAYGIGQFSDTIALQTFVFFIFTFYFAVVNLNINLITIVFIVWSLWNAFNDPLLGSLSDRTHSRWGRRKPFIILGIAPLCIVIVLLFTPILGSVFATFMYFLVMAIFFDISYTMVDLNYASLFPEMFQDLRERAKANTIKQFFTVLGLIVAFILPTLFIPKLDDPLYLPNYGFSAIIMAVIVGIGFTICAIFGIKERKEFSEDYKKAPSFLKSLKYSLKNKGFRTFIIANLCYWYVIGMLPTLVPLYGSFILEVGEGESFLLGLLLATTFISAAIFLPLWRYLAVKVGMRKGYMLANTVFIITLIPFLFIDNIIIAFIIFFLVGIGLSGALLFADILLAAVIDDDEITTGLRREGGYYGINALITKLSTIIVILSISLVFNSTGWAVFDPHPGINTIIGLKILISVFPAIALGIGIIAINRFPITKEKYKQIKIEMGKIHQEKREKTREE